MNNYSLQDKSLSIKIKIQKRIKLQIKLTKNDENGQVEHI